MSIHGESPRLLVYVYAPPWRHNSAGIKVLHYLVNAINEMGHESWLVLSNPKSSTSLTNVNLKTPILSQMQADEHFKQKRIPWVVYSETVPGNPLNANRVIRYLLNFPGNLGGPKSFDPAELIVSYSKKISDSIGMQCQTLFLPAVDLDELPTRKSKASKKGGLVYAGKYSAFIGKPDYSALGDVVEIFRDGSRAQPRDEVLKRLNESREVYLFENSTLATEALLLGTICIFIRSSFFDENITEFELGTDGIGFLGDQASIDRAHLTVDLYRAKYEDSIAGFHVSLSNLLSHLQDNSNGQCFGRRLRVPRKPIFLSRHRLSLLRSYLKHQGTPSAIRLVRLYLRSWIK